MPISPTLALQANMNYVGENAYWTDDDNTNDPWIGFAFRWDVTLDITSQLTSLHTSQSMFSYDGMDIQVGDWFASGQGGRANQIVEISQQSNGQLTCVLEDSERYNLFSDPTQSGSGLCDTGPGVVFRLNEDGLPVLGPFPPGYLGLTTVDDLIGRFLAHNNVRDYVLVKQHNHGMFVGDVIYADPDNTGQYKKTNAANVQHAIGVVSETNIPGLDYFSYRPLGRLINNVNPPLYGSHGTIFYLDPENDGQLTMDRPATNPIPIYMQLDLPNRAIMLERGVEQVGAASSTTAKYDVKNLVAGQTQFTMPSVAKSVLYMAINGVENEDFTFDVSSKALVFDPVKTGYGVDVDDEVFFIYTT